MDHVAEMNLFAVKRLLVCHLWNLYGEMDEVEKSRRRCVWYRQREVTALFCCLPLGFGFSGPWKTQGPPCLNVRARIQPWESKRYVETYSVEKFPPRPRADVPERYHTCDCSELICVIKHPAKQRDCRVDRVAVLALGFFREIRSKIRVGMTAPKLLIGTQHKFFKFLPI